MTTQFIPISLDDFEEQFNLPSKRDPARRAFELIRPDGFEAYYQCNLKETNTGTLSIKVYTSIAADKNNARDVGKDAIRISVIWTDKLGWTKAIGEKQKRIHRAGSTTSTAKDVVERTFNKAKEVAKVAMNTIYCNKCGRPMVKRKGSNGEFLGCIGFAKDLCRNSRNI